MSLNPKHKIFADKYLLTGNASESARHAGFNHKNVGVTGYKILNRPDVQAYLAAQATKLSSHQDDLQTRLIKEMEALAFANISDFIRIDADGLPQVDFTDATPEQLRAISSVASKRSKTTDKDGRVTENVESKFNMADKYRGLELLGKHLGMFKADEQRVVVDVADRLLAARSRYAQITQGGGG